MWIDASFGCSGGGPLGHPKVFINLVSMRDFGVSCPHADIHLMCV
jgi:uncharacterized Zn-finger protein